MSTVVRASERRQGLIRATRGGSAVDGLFDGYAISPGMRAAAEAGSVPVLSWSSPLSMCMAAGTAAGV